MSAGPYETGKYEADDGKIWNVKVQPETKGLTIDGTANAYPAEAATAGLPRLKLSVTRRSVGIRPRYVTIELTANGTGAYAEYTSGTRHSIVVFDPVAYADMALQDTGTYLGIACVVRLKSGEASS